MKNIGIIVGSLRKESLTKKIAQNIIESSNISFKLIDISKLELYNQDLEKESPASWKTFREEVKNQDAILFMTPEYNRSMPAALKNALDIGSRPYGKSAWDEKPAAIISTSAGSLAGFGANHHLRQSLVFLNMPTMQQPEAYIGSMGKLLDDNGKIKNEDTQKFLDEFIEAFMSWTSKLER